MHSSKVNIINPNITPTSFPNPSRIQNPSGLFIAKLPFCPNKQISRVIKVQTFATEVQIYVTEVQTYTTEVQTFAMEVQAFVMKVQAYVTEVQTYAMEV